MDVIPNKLLKKLFSVSLMEQTWNFMSTFYLNALRFFFRNVILKIKSKEALIHVCKDSCIASLQSSTETEFNQILQSTCTFFGLGLKKEDTLCAEYYQLTEGFEKRVSPLSMRRQVEEIKAIHMVISKQIKNIITSIQLNITSKISQGSPVSEETIIKLSHDIKRMRDILSNLIPDQTLSDDEHTCKVGLLCDIYISMFEK